MIMADNKDKKVLNVPALRFPEFSREWKRHKLSEICSFYSGGTPSSSKKEFYNGNIPFIRSGELHKDKTELFITEDGLNSSAAKLVEIGDLLLALYGATSGDIAISKIKGAINQAILCIRTKQNKKFIESVWNKHVERLLQTYLQGGQGNLSADIVKNIPFYFADLEEQDKLANFISLLDERISTQNKIIEDLKKLKSAISKQVFAQEPNGWSRLDTLFSKGKAGGTPTSTNKEYYNGEIPFLSINDITKQGKYVRYTENHLSQSGLENSSAWVVPKYSLIMSMYASVGLVTINEIPITTSQAMFAMQLKDKDLLDYLYYYLGQFTRNYTQTVKRAADNKRRYAPGEGSIPPVLLSGVSKGVPPLAHDFACKV
ncbi:restriction endonuclease subunit S [Bacteroides xylanisolvens]|nr:restriction endonuclease subunit S [Bacteroides nordii]